MMKNAFTILYFGLLAERRGLARETVPADLATAAELYAMLDARHGLGLDTGHFRVAVNDEFVAWDHALAAGDTVAFLPPMSGG